MHYARLYRHGDLETVKATMGQYQRGLSAEERFWRKVVPQPTGCWLWTANTTGRNGYGRFSGDGGQMLAYRWTYEQLVGPVPEGMELDHLCRVRLCVNPSHLEPVSHRENCMRGVSPAVEYAKRGACNRCGGPLVPRLIHRGRRGGKTLAGKDTVIRYCPECNRNWGKKTQLKAKAARVRP